MTRDTVRLASPTFTSKFSSSASVDAKEAANDVIAVAVGATPGSFSASRCRPAASGPNQNYQLFFSAASPPRVRKRLKIENVDTEDVQVAGNYSITAVQSAMCHQWFYLHVNTLTYEKLIYIRRQNMGTIW